MSVRTIGSRYDIARHFLGEPASERLAIPRMTQIESTTTHPSLSWKVSLPAALLILGAALSCSTACITSAVVGSVAAARREAEEKHEREVEDDLERQSIVQAIKPLLTRSDEVEQAGRLRVEGGSRSFSVAVHGDYSLQDAGTLLDAIRRLYASTLPFGTRVDLDVERIVQGNRLSVVRRTLDLTEETRAELLRHLPPAKISAVNREPLQVRLSADGKTLYIDAFGEFTSDAVRDFTDTARKLHSQLPRSPRFLVWMRRDAGDAKGLQVAGRFDSDMAASSLP